MPTDVLVLGDFVFTYFAVPEMLPGGGKQQMKVHKLPGGDRVIDTMGPDDNDRQFSVIHWGPGALDEVLTLDAMRISGDQYAYSNGAEARLVVISEFTWQIEKFNVIHSSIVLTPIDNPAGTSAGGFSSSDDLVGSDLGSASDAASTNVSSQSIGPNGLLGHN